MLASGDKLVWLCDPDNASSVIMSHFTGLPRARTKNLLEGCVVPWDVNQATSRGKKMDMLNHSTQPSLSVPDVCSGYHQS